MKNKKASLQAKIDLNKAVRLKGLVKSGNFDLTVKQSPSLNFKAPSSPNCKQKIFLNEDDVHLTSLLLDPKKLKSSSDAKYSKAVLVQHRSVWRNYLTRLAHKEQELSWQVDHIPEVLFSVRKQVQPLQIFMDNCQNQQTVPKNLNNYQKFIQDLLMRDYGDILIFSIMERGIDSTLTDLLRNNKRSSVSQALCDLGKQVVSRKSSLDSSGRSRSGSIQSIVTPSLAESMFDEIETSLENLRLEEERIEHSLPWLQDSVEEDVEENPVLAKIVKSKIPTKIKDPITDFLQKSSHESSFEVSDQNSRKKSLDQICNICGERLSVKFNFDTVNDPDDDRWLEFDCVKCSIERLEREEQSVGEGVMEKTEKDIEVSFRNEFGLDIRDKIQQNFSDILNDIMMFYTKKLDMLNIKLHQHSRLRAEKVNFDLAQTLMEVYSDHDNREELWKDMFCRLLPDSSMTYANSILRWMKEEQFIKNSISACMADLRRERDRVIVTMKQVIRKREEEKQRLWNLKEKVKLQETYCNNLRHLLEGLRHQRDVRLAEERRQVEEEEKKQKAKDQMEKEKQLLWHKKSWTAIKKHKKIQEELRAEKRTDLLQSLKQAASKRREKALQNYIRSNLRKVMAEQKNFEKARIKSEKEFDEKEREARLETLRRIGRRRLGIDVIKHNEEELSTALMSTKAWMEHSKVAEAERLHRLTGCGTLEMPIKTELFPINTYSDSAILSDNRILVENILREKNLLLNNAYAVSQMLKEINPPSRPRPDTISQLVL